ncbi:MAG: hypothetical protein IT537_12690 [Hyphomicrobiales bacterium]|nr:hypothetical protein [Hyphomicrobiales bacterium]
MGRPATRSKQKTHWWTTDARLSETSYFRHLSQQWRGLVRERPRPSSLATLAGQIVTADKGPSARTLYRVYWTKGEVTEAEFLDNRNQSKSAEYYDLNDALGWARHINKSVGIAWLIACPSGTSLTRAEIEEIVRKRESELAQRPLPRPVR